MHRLKTIAVALVLVTAAAANAAPAKPDAPEKASDAGDRMICKRFTETGSLAKRYRTCKTKAEWERERDNLRTLTVSDSCRNRANGDGC
ncbi:hypothetical protein [Sphingosinicella sp. BN140058]|uniref:hypothetical protein n=1 Tax=Sphingosinicella sp. BN140058 TaxID=1892855 RepID=UPI001010DE2F|nr:hypothetical protein [Sphingosinicella sp. BN140058]QAY77096.1 hypothetical protein ETR14_11740 [Sphingosinicella sp. BN140058]